MIVDHVDKCGLFFWFPLLFYFFSIWISIVLVLLKVVSDRAARAFNRSRATLVAVLDISKAFDRVWHAGLLHKLKSYGVSGQIFGLISSFFSNRWLQVVLDGESSREYSGNVRVPQGSVLGLSLFLLTLMTFLMMLSVILLSMLIILNIIRHLISSNN